MANGVVCGGQTYLAATSLAHPLIRLISCPRAASTAADIGLLGRLLQALVILDRKLGVDRQPQRLVVLSRQADGVFDHLRRSAG